MISLRKITLENRREVCLPNKIRSQHRPLTHSLVAENSPRSDRGLSL